MSIYRDLDAAQARVDELERENARLRAEKERAFETWWKDMGIALAASTVMGWFAIGLGWLALPPAVKAICSQTAHDAAIEVVRVLVSELPR